METTHVEQYHAGDVTDMGIKKISERDLRVEAFGGKSDKEIIDAFEVEKGIKDPKDKPKNFKNSVQIFDITNDNDKELFEGLMNSPRYYITKFNDHFSNVTGKYTVVCYYTEDLDSTFPPIAIKKTED